MGNQWLLDHRAQDEGGCWMVIHGVGWGGVLTSLVRTSNYVTDFFGIPTTLLSSLSTSNYASISCKLCFHYVVFSLSTSNYVSIPCKTSSKYVVIFSINFQLRWKLMWPNWCHQTDVTSSAEKNSRCHVQKLWPHWGLTVTFWNDAPKIEYFSGDEMSKFDGLCTEKQ